MTRKLLALLWTIAMLLPMSVDTMSATAAPPRLAQSLFFDAIFTSARTVGPGPGHVGHRQITSGILRDAAGRRLGNFSFTCTWTRVEPSGAAEHCRASAFTPDGRLDVAGASQSNSVMQTWRLIAGSGAYRAASGQVTVRDLGDQEALLSAAVRTPDNIALHAGKLNRPAANQSFIARGDDLCRRAATALASLPKFPFANFDPLHPDPSILRDVGAFFTGPGDARPILHALNTGLDQLGQPPRARQVWRLAMRARARELAVIDEQDRAALGGHVPAFVSSVHQSLASFRRVAITETVFGSTRCIL